MSIPELASLARRQWIVVLIVILVTVAFAYHFKRAVPLNQDSGNLLFSTTPSLQAGQHKQPTVSIDPLIITADVMVDWLNSPQGARRVVQDGGTGGYQFGLVNFYDQEYPQYLQPLATLNTTSYSPIVAQRTFAAAMRAVQQELQAQQRAQGVPSYARISAYLVGSSTGPVSLSGYPKRTYVGLLLLALMAAYFGAKLLDRKPRWAAQLQVGHRLRVTRSRDSDLASLGR